MVPELTRELIEQAFDRMGALAANRGLMIEIAVYGGSCLVLASDIRTSSADVEAVFLSNRSAVYEIADAVAKEMRFATDWINEAVRQTAPPVGNPQPNLLPWRLSTTNPVGRWATCPCSGSRLLAGDEGLGKPSRRGLVENSVGPGRRPRPDEAHRDRLPRGDYRPLETMLSEYTRYPGAKAQSANQRKDRLVDVPIKPLPRPVLERWHRPCDQVCVVATHCAVTSSDSSTNSMPTVTRPAAARASRRRLV